MKQTCTACLSTQALGEFAREALRKLDPPLTPAQTYEQVALLMETWQILHLTPQIVLEACRGVRDHQLAYYEAQMWASARLNQLSAVLSEDFQDGQTLEGVRFINPVAEYFEINQL